MTSEPTPASSLSRERLNQIAQRKLSALGLATRTTPAGLLEGEWVFTPGKLLHPGTGEPLARSRFRVDGHDHLRLMDAPLSALPLLLFYDTQQVHLLEDRLGGLLQERMAALGGVAKAFSKLGLSAQLDAQLLALRATAQTVSHRFELLGTPETVRVLSVSPLHGKGFEVASGAPPLSLASFASPVDLELFLEDALPRLKSAGAVSAAAPSISVKIEPVPPPSQALTLGRLLEKFGPDAVITIQGAIELSQEFTRGPTRFRFSAVTEAGGQFKARLVGPSGETWSDRFELGRFPGVPSLLRSALGSVGGEQEPKSSPAAPAAPSLPNTPDYLLPHAGERWVMNVLIEKESPEEVRYVCTNVEGQPYGAARVLARRDFDAAFVRGGAGNSQLQILIDGVEGDTVVYRQCDARREPRGQPRRLQIGVLVTTFVPEAAAY